VTHGAKVWIIPDGKSWLLRCNAVQRFLAELQHLPAGKYLADTFIYAIGLRNGALSWARATVQIDGANDAPVIAMR